MKIIAIRLKNLTSIEGSVEIDFYGGTVIFGWYICNFRCYRSGKVDFVGCSVWHYMIRLPVLRLRWSQS